MPGRPFSSFSSLCRVAVLFAALVALGAGVATAQPTLVADLETRSTTTLNADPAGFVPLGDRLYFFATDPLNGRELWATDGTEAGTELVIDLCPGPCSSNPDSLIAAQGQLFWIADDGVSGAEPWTSDGTAEGTHPLRDICPGACGSLAATPGAWSPQAASSTSGPLPAPRHRSCGAPTAARPAPSGWPPSDRERHTPGWAS